MDKIFRDGSIHHGSELPITDYMMDRSARTDSDAN